MTKFNAETFSQPRGLMGKPLTAEDCREMTRELKKDWLDVKEFWYRISLELDRERLVNHNVD